ncbi:hypothetical protein MN608_04549 [Microdochium nivale]|nr:hypothetical protein MN608_04549 [Microdochium nivale]
MQRDEINEKRKLGLAPYDSKARKDTESTSKQNYRMTFLIIVSWKILASFFLVVRNHSIWLSISGHRERSDLGCIFMLAVVVIFYTGNMAMLCCAKPGLLFEFIDILYGNLSRPGLMLFYIPIA